MVNIDEQQFLNALDKKLWTSADKLRSTLDASQYKNTVLGLIFLKYVSDSFDSRRQELSAQFKNPEHEYYLDPADFGGEDSEQYQAEINTELEQRDYYAETNVFWVPKVARWEFLQNQNKVVINGVIWLNRAGEVLTQAPEDDTEKRLCTRISSVGQLIDHALEAIEQDNTKLKGILNKRYTSLQIDPAKLGELIDLIATIPFKHDSLSSKDILGHVYEYFLGQFALAEGKKGGQFYTPKSIVSLIVQMLEPFKGRVYDPAMGSGGFFVQSENFIREHQGRMADVSIYGQEYNHTTWQLAAMNMVIRGIGFDFGKEPANTYTNDQHPDLRADFVMANPPFNMREWDTGVSDDDPRWVYGKPPSGNANFAWLQHMLYHLAPNGSLGLLLANGSMSSNTNNEGAIRKSLIENDLVECMVALPGQLFTNTQIPACIWFLTKNKGQRISASGRTLRDRKGEILFIDARNLGYMKDRVLRDFTQDDLNKVTDTFHAWQTVGWADDLESLPGCIGHAGGTTPRMGEVELRPEQQSRAMQGAIAEVRTPTYAEADVGIPNVTPTYADGQTTVRPEREERAVEGQYQDIPAFCKSATLSEIQKHDYVLTPGRYVGAADAVDDGEVFAEKMARLTAQLKSQFEQSDKLEAEIKKNLAGLGYEF